MQFQCWQIKHPIPQFSKDNIKNSAGNLSNLSIQDPHLIKCHKIFNLEKLNSRELWKIQLSLKYEKQTCQAYYEKKFDNYNFVWKIIYGIPRIATYDRKVCVFQYKLLTVLYLNQKLYQFGIFSCSKWHIPSVIYMTKNHCIYIMNVFNAQNIWNQLI